MKKILCTALVCYPESIPNKAEFLNEIEKSISVGFKSILHNKDTDKEGKLKKEHYHLLFQGTLTQSEWKRVYALTGVKHHEDMFTAKASEEYLTHDNNADKHHYNKEEIYTSSTWDNDTWERILEKENELAEEKDSNADFTIEILTAIEENDINNFRDLTKYVMSNMNKDAFKILVKNTYFFSQYLRG